VWHIRDELARDSEVLHLPWGVSYKSGVYAVKALCLTPGGLSVGLAVGYDDLVTVGGKVGVGTATPASRLTVAGAIESTAGGFRFPDGSVQTTAASGGGHLVGTTAVSVTVFGQNTFEDDSHSVNLTLEEPSRVLLLFTGTMGFGSTVQSQSLQSLFNIDQGSSLIGNFSFTPFPWTNHASSVPASASAVTESLEAGAHSFRMRIGVNTASLGAYGGNLSGRLTAIVIR